jgi:hypothetical protein
MQKRDKDEEFDLSLKPSEPRDVLDLTDSPILGQTALENLTGRQRDFLAGRTKMLDAKVAAERAFDIGFIARYQDNFRNRLFFHRMMRLGRVLWTLDVEGTLSIGSERSGLKHAILSGGKDVWGAGEAQIKRVGDLLAEEGKITGLQLSLVTNIDDYEARIKRYEQLARDGKMSEADMKDARQLDGELITATIEELGGWSVYQQVKDVIAEGEKRLATQPPTVILDFASGHYTPRGAWRKAAEAWNKAGFQVKWNPNTNFV